MTHGTGLSTALRHPALWRGSDLASTRLPGVPSGFEVLDAELPGSGWPVGALVELMPEHEGIGELRLLGPVLSSICAQQRKIAWIAPPYLPYAPALAAAGIDTGQIVIVRTSASKNALWATEQALASNACGAVLAWLDAPRYEDLRRLQLAAEGAQALAFLFRSPLAARQPSPAGLRMVLSTLDGGLALHLVKRRGAPLARPVIISAQQAGTPARRKSQKLVSHDLDRHSSARASARHLVARIAAA